MPLAHATPLLLLLLVQVTPALTLLLLLQLTLALLLLLLLAACGRAWTHGLLRMGSGAWPTAFAWPCRCHAGASGRLARCACGIIMRRCSTCADDAAPLSAIR